MRELVVSQFLAFDGVMEAPEIWNGNFMDDQEVVSDILHGFEEAGSFLFGRTTYEFFGARWPSRTGPMADKLNNLPKYVVSKTLKKAEWNNSTIIAGDINDEIKKLKALPGKKILLLGSYHLVQELMKHHLIDAYKLYVYPLTLGSGKRLFEDGKAGQKMDLIKADFYSSGVIGLVYRPKINISA